MTTNAEDNDKTGNAVARPELIKRLADKSGLSLRDAKRALESFETLILDALSDLESVRLKGIGTLRPAWRSGAVIRSPHDQKRMFLDGRWSIGFRPSVTAKRALATKTPGHFRSEAHQRAWRLAETLVADLAAYAPTLSPTNLTSETPDAEVREACEKVFRGNWTRAANTWSGQTPEDVATERDYLAAAARAKWSS